MDTYIFELETESGYQAEIAISGNVNLYGLAEHIIDTVGFDFDHAFGFYDNLKNPYSSGIRYTLFSDMGEGDEQDRSVQKTLIEEVFEAGSKMLFLFDYGDDWLFSLVCKSIEPGATKRKVRKVLSERGTPPVQYPDYEDE